MKQDLKTKLINRKIKKANPFLMSIAMFVLGILNRKYKVKFNYNYNYKTLKKEPVILLASHASRNEFIYMIYGFKHKDINIVCGYQNIIKKGLYKLLTGLGVISKYLYQPDVVCVKNIFKVLKRNGKIVIFPEGIQSTSGSTHPINPATVQFIKRSKANVVVSTSKGAYLSTNRYSKDRKKGNIEVDFELLLTPSMLEELTEEQIYNLLLGKIKYNDFEYNKKARNKYIGKNSNAFGITKILYKCPTCKEENTLYVEENNIICKHCGLKVEVNEYYDLVSITSHNTPKDIDEWYKWQRRCVVKEIQNDDFELSLSGSICTLKLDKLRKEPKDKEVLSIGELILNNKGLSFKGTLNDKEVNYDFTPKSIYSLTLTRRGYLEFYNNNDYYIIIPDDLNQCLIKWTLASEEIHNLYDEKWKSACADVYDYSKGDIYE